MRGLGELAVVSDFPPVVVDLFGLVTRLGDPWLLLGALALSYAFSESLGIDRRRVGFVFAAAFVALGVTLALKSAFALPRPPGALEDGYGFPSGHALGSTVVWGTAALVLDVGRRRTRLAVAGLVIPAVALSRVVIGVHYLVDVVVGVTLGVLVVALVVALGPRREAGTYSHAAVGRIFVLAAVAGLAALLVGQSADTLLTVGATLGGWSGWRLAEPTLASPTQSPPRRGTAVSVLALPVVLGGLLAVERLARAATIPGTLSMALAGGCVALLFALPRLAA
jgi:hypothetical protein